jgi:hypothetical protein
MAKGFPVRSWATPLTIGSFVLMTVTGVLMFFEVDWALMAVLHQWFSWLFLLGAGGHIGANLRPFKNHLKSGWGQASSAVCALVLIASFFTWGLITGPQLERPIEEKLVDAPLSALAGLVQTTPEDLVRRLSAHGIAAAGEQSIREISGASGAGENLLLGIVFLSE